MKSAKKAVRKAAETRKKAEAKKATRASRAVARDNGVSPQVRRVILEDQIDEMHTIGKQSWILVHRPLGVCLKDEHCRYSRHCALLPTGIAKAAMKSARGDIQQEDGLPKWWRSGKDDMEYRRFDGCAGGIEPLIFLREHFGFKPKYPELSEEFRLYHDLYYEEGKGEYVKFDASGNPSPIVRISGGEVRIRTREIRQFLAVKRMSLAIFLWTFRTEMGGDISDIPESKREKKARKRYLAYDFKVRREPQLSPGRGGLISRLEGKSLIPPCPLREVELRASDGEKDGEFPCFWTRELASGRDVRYSCDPDKLPEGPMSVVICRSAVLRKYRDSDHFIVMSSGIGYEHELTCYIYIIQQNADCVAVYLGDLGHLPKEDRRHWAEHNIRHSEGDATPQPDNQYDFRDLYENINEVWKKRHGWTLFRPLEKEDRYHLRRLHIPSSDDQGEFDEQMRSLAILLIEYLNKDGLNGDNMERGKKGNIDALNVMLEKRDIRGRERWISFLRNLQEIRSSGVAHAKDEARYPKALSNMGVHPNNLKDGFASVLQKAVQFLQWLHDICR